LAFSLPLSGFRAFDHPRGQPPGPSGNDGYWAGSAEMIMSLLRFAFGINVIPFPRRMRRKPH
jgi:hypothetical protein